MQQLTMRSTPTRENVRFFGSLTKTIATLKVGSQPVGGRVNFDVIFAKHHHATRFDKKSKSEK